jgi:hypothetical protein
METSSSCPLSTPRGICKKPGNGAQHWTASSASSARIGQELGYQEPVAIEEAIRRTICWEQENPPAGVPLAQFDYAAADCGGNTPRQMSLITESSSH